MSVASLVAKAYSFDLAANATQRALSARWVTPRLDEILTTLRRLREEIDAVFAPKIAADRTNAAQGTVYGEQYWRYYPIGFCRQIRDAVLERMRREPLIRELVEQGVVLKPIFIFLKSSYFQNAIQLGHFYLDAANDTVFPEKPKIDWAPLQKLDFENLDSWSRFIEVARRYLKVEIYPNRFFPLGFLAAPLLAIRPNGRLDLLLAQHQIPLKDLGDDLQRTRALLDDKAFMQRPLPPFYADRLNAVFGANQFSQLPLEYAPSTPDMIRNGVVREFRDLLHQPDAQTFPVVSAYFELVTKSVRLLRQTDIRPSSEMLEQLRAQQLVPSAAEAPKGWSVD